MTSTISKDQDSGPQYLTDGSCKIGEWVEDDRTVEVSVRRYVAVEFGVEESRFTAANARKLAKALLAAADDLDG